MSVINNYYVYVYLNPFVFGEYKTDYYIFKNITNNGWRLS